MRGGDLKEEGQRTAHWLEGNSRENLANTQNVFRLFIKQYNTVEIIKHQNSSMLNSYTGSGATGSAQRAGSPSEPSDLPTSGERMLDVPSKHYTSRSYRTINDNADHATLIHCLSSIIKQRNSYLTGFYLLTSVCNSNIKNSPRSLSIYIYIYIYISINIYILTVYCH